MFDFLANHLPAQWFDLDSPFLYWFVTYLFGPAFTMGYWGLVAVFLAHLIPLVWFLVKKWQSLKVKSLFKRVLTVLTACLLIHLAVGLLFWLCLPLFMALFYRP